MHGLINRSLQCFLTDTYGQKTWQAIARAAEVEPDGFEALLTYEDALTEAVLEAAASQLGTAREMILEDLGVYLVSHPNVTAVRRLLRFGGETFDEFLESLDELHDRARLAVADLNLPVLELRSRSNVDFTLLVRHAHPGFGHVIVGVLRAMADEYGALVLLEHQGRSDTVETISIELLMTAFAEGRGFALAAGAA